jgi:hypothetical protein
MRIALTTRVAAGQQRGDIPHDVDADAIAMLIVAACHQAAPHAFVAGKRGRAAGAIADEISPLMDTRLARSETSPRPRHRTNAATRRGGSNRQTQSR